MGEQTGISWTDATFNPWLGCTKISPGCDHCYAEGWAKRSGRVGWGAQAARRLTSDAYWRQPEKWDAEAAAAGIRRRVFCASLADVFDKQARSEWRTRLWAVIRRTPHLDWLLLTKRPQLIAPALPADWGDGWPNVWLGTTVENRAEGERRIPHLQAVPAAVRFLSCEPLLEAIDPDLTGIGWVIVGGESGGGARPYRPEWARALLARCRAGGVPFFHKQVGSRRDGWEGITGKGDKPAEWPVDLRVQEFPAPGVGLLTGKQPPKTAGIPALDCQQAPGAGLLTGKQPPKTAGIPTPDCQPAPGGGGAGLLTGKQPPKTAGIPTPDYRPSETRCVRCGGFGWLPVAEPESQGGALTVPCERCAAPPKEAGHV